MMNKIAYLMEKDTRLVVNNLTKVIIDEDTVVIKYTVFRKDLNDETITALRYYKSKNAMIIYDELKKHNKNAYNSFIKWARENDIKCIKSKEETMGVKIDIKKILELAKITNETIVEKMED